MTNLTITQKVEKKITDLKAPLSKFYKEINSEIDEIAGKELSPELKKEASAKRTELRTKRIACTKFIKNEIDIFKGYVDDWKAVDSYAKLQSKNGEERLIQIEEDCKAKAEEVITALANERFKELEALGETVLPEGLGKMPKMEFKLLLKTTERKVQERIKAEAEAKELHEEAEKLKAENKRLKDQAEADAKELAEFRKMKAEATPEPASEPKKKPVKAGDNKSVINKWVESIEMPKLDTTGFSEKELDKVEFIKNCFTMFKKDSVIK
tara:strand:+ start:3612 stop:4415 length:804 start_codon:yes stop_codon:yes gene_type:complete